jgi:neopullulanase
MRVLLDGVFNHASRGLLQFHDLLENGSASPYADWFHIHRFPLNAYGGGPLGYDAWWGLPALPKFDTSNPAVRDFLWRVGEHWLRQGVDGWRLDVPNEIDDDAFWQEFRRRCRAVNGDAYLVGEIWTDAGRWLKGDIFDGVMNYPLTRAIYGLVGRALAETELAKSGLNGVQALDAGGFAEQANHLLTAYPEGAVRSQMNLLGSHDTPRLLTALGGDLAAVGQAWLLLFALPGAPCIYYGDEIGLEGGHDPYCRAGMPWERKDEWNHELLQLIKRLTRLRTEREELRRGGTTVSAPKQDLVLIQRQLGPKRLYVLVNTAGAASTVPEDAVPRGAYTDLLTGAAVQLQNGAAAVPARGGLILAPA